MEPVLTARWAPNAVEQTREIEDFDAVVRLYWPKIFRFALASLRDRDAAESLAQDCFLKAYRARQGFRGEASLSTWLMQIAVNLVRDSIRNRRLRFWNRTRAAAPDFDLASQSLADRGSSPEGAVLAKERVAAVWSAVETLSERQRTVFLLRFVEDLDLLEITAVTGLREGTVKVHLFRALEGVRKRMGETT
jgi:RNA polymerase sigma-70 factor (ECF subfamily)